MKRLLIILLCLGLSLPYARGQEFDKERLDNYFEHLAKHDRAMGSISIFRNGEEVYQKTIGMAYMENNDPVNADRNTIYRIGSVSKMYTAAVIMKLIEEGKISLETTIDEFFPSFPLAEEITIDNLLSHQSGIYNITNSPDYVAWMTQPFTREKLMEKIKGYDRVFEPGTKNEYSNSNYILLTYIAEDVEENSFWEILNSYIIGKCDLQHTVWSLSPDIENNEAMSFNKMNQWIPAPVTHGSIPLGAGALAATSTDVNRFLNCLFSGKIIADSTLAIMKDVSDGMGMGMFSFPFYDRTALGHTGGIDGYQSMTGYYEEENVAITYLSNGVQFSTNDVMIGAMSIFFGRDYEFPDFETKEIQVAASILKSYEGNYTTETLPINITIGLREDKLWAQATGQSAFPLTPVSDNRFVFKQAGIEMEFTPSENKMLFNQAGRTFEMKREQ